MSLQKLVFCEGLDDEAIIKGVGATVPVPDLKTEAIAGGTKFRSILKTVRAREEFVQKKVGSIAIIRDADDDAANSFQSCRDALQASGFSFPTKSGEVVASDIKVGILIIAPLPGGKGMIEDLCLNSVSSRPEYACLDEWFKCLKDKSGRTDFHSKVRFRTWMATFSDRRLDVRRAAEAGIWQWKDPAFDELREFLKAL